MQKKKEESSRKKISAQQRTLKFQQDMLTAYDKYLEARAELSAYEGKAIDDVGLDKVNDMLAKVQDTFKEIYPVLNFIQNYFQFSTTAINYHADLIEVLKREGAQEVEPPKN